MGRKPKYPIERKYEILKQYNEQTKEKIKECRRNMKSMKETYVLACEEYEKYIYKLKENYKNKKK